MTQVTHIRNPYPLPDLSREGEWIAGRPVLGRNVSPDDENWDSKLPPHERLFAHHTLNSIRKDNRLYRPQVPKDALDLALTSIYVHSKDTLVPKMYVPMQPEAMGKETWRQLRNELKRSKRPPAIRRELTSKPSDDRFKRSDGKDDSSFLNDCHRGPMVERRIHPCSVKLNIPAPHSERTNNGYSRKPDGTFYGI